MLLFISSRVSLSRRRGLATWSSSHLHWQMSLKSNSFHPCRGSEICFTLIIIAVRRPLIIKYSSTHHSLLVVGVFGVWGFGVMGLSFLPQAVTFLSGENDSMRPVVSITCSGVMFSHGNFPVEFFPWNFSHGVLLWRFPFSWVVGPFLM